MRQAEETRDPLNLIQIGAVIVGVVGIILSVIGASLDVEHFLHIYLVAFLFWLELSLGCLAMLMLPNIVSAPWNLAIERVMAAGARTLPLMGLLFLPLLFGINEWLPWVEEANAGAELSELDNFNLYLATPLFVIRAVLYFAIWIGLAYILPALSYQRDNSDDENLVRRANFFSLLGGVLFFITATFAAFDWSMAIEEEWFSSVYGWLAISRMGLSALALAIVVLAIVARRTAVAQALKPRVIGDLGALLLVGLVGWAYLAFTQYIVIWSGNVSSKTIWYADRVEADWGGFIAFIIAVHAIIFVLMVLPGVKRIWGVLVGMAAVLLVMRLFDMYWTVMPTFRPELVMEWWDLALPFGIGGLWVALFIWAFKARSLVPLNRSNLAIEVEQEEEGYEAA